jgi:hypothetical protein
MASKLETEGGVFTGAAGSQGPYIHGYTVCGRGFRRVPISTHGYGGGGDPSTKMVDLRHHTLSIGPLEFF